jgi:diaminopimelate decarboxylase
MKNLLQVARQFPDLESIDFGGGLGVVYKPNDKPIDLRGFGRDVRAVFDAFTKSYGRELMMAFENGRYYVCEAGVLLTRVNTLKEVEGKTFVGTDSGFNHLIRHAMYGSYHPILNADKVEGDPKRNVTICGNICESGDCFARDREMPPIAEGDVMAILNAGAYGFSMASEYNSRVLPAEVMVQHGKSRIIRKRGTYDDLCRNQTV